LGSVRLAVAKAGDRGRGAVAASDGFFPFPDSIELLAAAGVTAAIYAARRQLNIKLIAGDIGGEIATTDIIENYPGYVKVGGLELAEKFKEQLKYNNVSVDEGWLAKKIEKKDNYFVVTAKNFSDKEKTYETKTVIVATGVHPRHLGVPGEKELLGKGVHYCFTCDGPLYGGKRVAVVGGGDSSVKAVNFLSENDVFVN